MPCLYTYLAAQGTESSKSLVRSRRDASLMGKNQGIRRLRKGITRTLTRHELNRDYVYVSQDRELPEILDAKNFAVEIDGALIERRRISVSGRVHVKKAILGGIGTSTPVTIRVVSQGKLEIKPQR